MASGRRVVYLTYDGLEDPLGQSQVMPYVRGLVGRGHQVHIVSFEKKPHRLRLAEPIAPGLRWTALRYHRTPTVPATAFDMAQGLATSGLRAALDGADLLHTRALVPCAMALPLARATGLPLIFDTRSLWPDEKVDVGHWPRGGRLYQAAKAVERAAFRSADAITTLTNDYVRFLRDEYPHRAEISAPIRVIPTCADLTTFRPDATPDPDLARELGDHSVLLYLGSMGPWYLPEVMVRFYLAWREVAGPSRFLVVTRGSPEEILGPLRERGLAHEVVHRSATREQVASYVRCAQATLCFILPAFSKRASAPTKLGEMLGCGLPVVANPIGDVAQILGETRAGVVLDQLDDEALARGARDLFERSLDPAVPADARRTAERWFSLEKAVDAYDALYRDLRRPGEPRRPLPDRPWPLADR